MYADLQTYINIALKLITGMLGILVFLRITGKAHSVCIGCVDCL